MAFGEHELLSSRHPDCNVGGVCLCVQGLLFRMYGVRECWAVWKSQVFDYAAKLVAKLPDTERVKVSKVIADLRCPVTCWENFLHEADSDQGAVGEEDLEMEDAARAVPQSKIAQVKENFNKSIGMLLDLLLELMSGKFYKDCCRLASGEDGLAKALTQAQNSAEAANNEAASCSLITQLKVIVEKFDNTNKSVGPSSAAPAPSLLASLASVGDSPAAEEIAERERQWKVVQTERRKFVSFSVPRAVTKDALLGAFRSCGKVFSHKGSLNSSHRLVCASADLLTEDGTEPWSTPTKPLEDKWKEICNFTSCMSGTEDFIVVFDGRMREVRRMNDSGPPN